MRHRVAGNDRAGAGADAWGSLDIGLGFCVDRAMRSDLIELEVSVHWETTKMVDNEDRGAWLVETDVSSPKKVWVPKSWCEISDQKPKPSKQATMTISRAQAEEKGLV